MPPEPKLAVRPATMRRNRAPHDEPRLTQACGGRQACRQLRATGHLTSICTKTTFDVNDRLTERASRQYLARPVSTARPFRAGLVITGGQPVAGVNVDDREALYERMDGRG